MSNPYCTMIWLARLQGLQSHLRIIARECEGSDNPHIQRIGRQAAAGVAEAQRYVDDKEEEAR